ncbi:MAG: recombinase family protein [Hyphomicrobiales bacterium]|nr:recombinase family protein [Hyphomicrobiales bacterium]
MKPAISYIRVSTKDQAHNGSGLDQQLRAIKSYAKRNGYELLAFFEDIGSGRQTGGGNDRAGLIDALKFMKNNRATLIVSDISRLYRDFPECEALLRKYEGNIIKSCHPEQRSSAARLLAAEKADTAGKNIAAGTVAALAELKRGGKRLGNLASLPEARRNSIRARREKAEDRLFGLIKVLMEHPALQELGAGRLAMELNRLGQRTSKGELWTRHSLKKPLKAARDWISDDASCNQYLNETPASLAPEVSPAVSSVGMKVGQVDGEVVYAYNPRAGMF